MLSRAEIEKAGVTTAPEILRRMSANVNSLADRASSNVGGDQRGFNSATLRTVRNPAPADAHPGAARGMR